ncbi:MAG: translocation/assembly module TamB domain-containing protein [Armatimonadetes bacterium]|nr:translocation/assembly module TamB domain-containing protein [Armatimonadota bacterium]
MARWVAPIFVAIAFVSLITIGIWQARKHLPKPDEWARLLELELTKTLNVPVKIGSADIGLTGALIENLQIQPEARSPTGYILTVPKLQFRWSLKEVLRPSQWKQVVRAQIERALHQVIVTNATLFLWRDRTGRWNFQPFIVQRPKRPAAQIPILRVKESTLIIGDETLPLPDGLPFRLKLVNVQATVEPIELGTRIIASGQFEPPFGSENSRVNLTISQIGHETFPETHGRLVATGIRINYLPKRFQEFFDGKLKLVGGTVSIFVLNWHQCEEIGQISGAADLNAVPVALKFQKPVNLKPIHAFLSFALSMTNRKVNNWHLTIRTTKPHRDLGQGAVALEGLGKFLRVRWSGKNFAVANLDLFAQNNLPIRDGNLSGSVLFENEGKRMRIDADLTINASHFRPVAQLQKLSLRPFKIRQTKAQIRIERVGVRWKGNFTVASKSDIGQGRVKVWLNGKQGRAEGEVLNLRLEPFNAAILSFVPSQIRNSAKMGNGVVSGAFSVSWSGRKFRLERVLGRFHQVSFESEWSPPVRLSAQVQMDGSKLRLSNLNVTVDKNATAVLSGQVTVSKEPIWQVQGQISSSAMERLMAWAKAKWNLPVHLLRGGQTQIGAMGVGTKWQAQLAWTEPLGVIDLKGLGWQTGLDKLSLFATPRGALATVNQVTAKTSTTRIKTKSVDWKLLEGIRFSEWAITWDEKRKSLIAFGSVKVPQIDLDGIEIRDGSADLELAFMLTDKPAVELNAFNLRAKTLKGELSAGQLNLLAGDGNKFAIKTLLRFQDSDIGELVQWAKKRSDSDFFAEGRFNGEIAISVATASQRETSDTKQDGLKAATVGENSQRTSETPLTLQATVIGSVSGLNLGNGKLKASGQKLTLTALTISAAQTDDQWSFRQIAGEGIGRDFVVKSDGRELQIARLQLQSFAKQEKEGWFWDFRLPQVQTLGGTINGQGNASPNRAEGHFGFANLDISQLSRLLDLKLGESLPEGKGSGWIKFEASRKSVEWKGDWEGATLLEEASWQDWNVKVAGARAKGQFVADERNNLQLSGLIEGVHILSEDGQAVLDGKFAFRQGIGLVSIQGKWTGLSLRRLSRKFNLPIQLQGIAEGTLQILWDGKWRIGGTAKSQAVAVGDSAIWRDVSGEWFWQDRMVQIKRARAKWNGGTVTANGVIGTSPDASVNLTVQGEKLALSDLSQLLRDWKLPLSDWRWFGQADAQLLVSRTNGQLRLTASLNGQQVRLGLAELGETRLDLTVMQQSQRDRKSVSAKGIVNIQRNGMAVTAEFEGVQPDWQISWHGGNIPIATLRGVFREWQRQNGAKVDDFEHWLKLPVAGEVWTKGRASFVKNQTSSLQAEVSVPNLRGVGDAPAQADLTILRAEKFWTVKLNELKRGNANAFGSIAIADDGKLEGELTMKQVPSELAASLLALFGVKVESGLLPEGSLNAHIKIAGSSETPVVEGTLQANEVYWRGWTMRQIFVRRFDVQDGVIKIERGDGVIRWRTDASLASFWGWMELRGKRKMHWQIELPPTSLDAILPPDLPLEVERGWLSGSLALQGSWKEPSLKGSIEVVADEIDFTPSNSLPKAVKTLTKFQNLRCQVFADGRAVKLAKLEAGFGGGALDGSGWLELGESGLQNLFANKGELRVKMQGVHFDWNGTNLNLRTALLRGNLGERGFGLFVEQMRGDGLEMHGGVQWEQIPQDGWSWLSEGRWNLELQVNGFRWQTKGAKGRLSGYIALKSEQANEPPILKGNLTVHDGDVLRLPVAATGGNGKWQLPDALRLSLRLGVGDKFFLRNPQASLLLDGELLLAGSLSQPRIEGELRSQRGTLKLPASVLTITDMSVRVAYAVDPLTRRWLGTARMRVDGETQLDIHRVLFTVSGPVDEHSQRLGILPSVTMLAVPPLPEQTALERMFGLGLAQLGDVLTNWQQLFSGAFVQSFMGNLLAPVTEPIAQALRWTELSVIREQTTGRQWLRLGIPLAPRLHVLWRQGLSPADPSALEVQYYLGKRTSVTIIKREREQAEIRVQTSIRF